MGDLRVTRTGFGSKSCEGEMFLDDARECATLEDRSRGLRGDMPLAEIQRLKVYGETAIPTGRYALELYNSPKHGPDTLQLVNVPGFDHVQIHIANKAEELLGCIAVGKDPTTPDDDWIGQSGVALKELRAKIIPRMKAGESFWITVEERR